MKLLAIDIGASGGKAVLGEFTGRGLAVSELRRFPNGMIDVNGHKHWDALRLFEECKECLRAAPPDFAGAGIDTWGVDYGYVAADGDLLGLPFAYRDARTAAGVERVGARIPRDRLYGLNGLQFMPFNTIYQVAEDLQSRPWLVERADKLLMMPELLGFLLTGEAVAEYSEASTSGLLDARTRRWSGELLAAVGFPPERLAAVAAPGAARARLSAGVGRETGSRAEIVWPACHDTGSAVAAVPAAGEGWAFISSGTWSLVGMELAAPVLTEASRKLNFTNEGGVGGTVRFLKNVTGLWLLEELRRGWVRMGQSLDFAEIAAAARRAPAFGSLVDPDDPSFAAPPDMQSAIAEFCRRTGQAVPEGAGPLARCVFESLALACRRAVRQLEQASGREVGRLHAVGGGSRNELLCQMTADACSLPLHAGPFEATALGNLLVQAIAHGAVKDVAEGRRLIAASQPPREHLPARDAARWDAAAARFEALGKL